MHKQAKQLLKESLSKDGVGAPLQSDELQPTEPVDLAALQRMTDLDIDALKRRVRATGTGMGGLTGGGLGYVAAKALDVNPKAQILSTLGGAGLGSLLGYERSKTISGDPSRYGRLFDAGFGGLMGSGLGGLLGAAASSMSDRPASDLALKGMVIGGPVGALTAYQHSGLAPDNDTSISTPPAEKFSHVKEATARVLKSAIRGEGMGQGRPAQQDGGASQCVCSECGHTESHSRGTPCNEKACPECGAPMAGFNLSTDMVERSSKQAMSQADMMGRKNAPTLAYEAVYGELPPTFLPGRTAEETKVVDNIPVDVPLKDEWVKQLNSIEGVEGRSSCAGHDSERVPYFIFRMAPSKDDKAQAVADKLKEEGVEAKQEIGNRGRPRIVVATDKQRDADEEGWNEWWSNLPGKIQQAVNEATDQNKDSEKIAFIMKRAYIEKQKGTNSEGEETKWVIKSHETDEVIGHYKTKEDAEKALQAMHANS